MGLQVWLPLNGDLKNQGLSNSTATNNGCTINDDGKIGKCLKLSGGYVTMPIDISNTAFTMATWIKYTSFPTNSNNYSVCLNSSTSSDFQLSIGAYNGKYAIRYNGTTKQLGSYSTNTWYHIAVTYNSVNMEVYVNGELLTSYAVSSVSKANKLTLGGRNASTTGNPSSFLNDVRIYDEVLSEKEIREIAKGLVLHYKLNSFENPENLITSLSAGGRTTVENNSIRTTGENADTYFYLNTSKALVSGKSYTIMCLGSDFANNSVSFNFPIGSQTNTGPGIFEIKEGLNIFSFIANDIIANAGTRIIMDDISRSAYANKCLFSNFYLYENTQIIDCSGNNYNGIVNGPLTISSDTAKYLGSTVFNGIDTFITTTALNEDSCKTISFWSKVTSLPSDNRVIFADYGSQAAFGFWSSGFIVKCGTGSSSPTFPKTTYINNQWNHVVLLFNKTTPRLFINGVEVVASTTLNIWTHATNNLSIGTRSAGSYYDGKLCDFRIYATTLSSDDIKELYDLSPRIDNKNNIWCSEIVEV